MQYHEDIFAYGTYYILHLNLVSKYVIRRGKRNANIYSNNTIITLKNFHLSGRTDETNALIEKYKTIDFKVILRNDIVELWLKCLININDINTDL
ncbi:hypothetical protein U3516DRAFT_755474 [Neocallimastix sp. 'constans']